MSDPGADAVVDLVAVLIAHGACLTAGDGHSASIVHETHAIRDGERRFMCRIGDRTVTGDDPSGPAEAFVDTVGTMSAYAIAVHAMLAAWPVHLAEENDRSSNRSGTCGST